MVKQSWWGSLTVMDDPWNGVAVQCADALALDLETPLITLSDYFSDVISGQGKVVDPVECADEVIQVRVAVFVELDAVLARVVAKSIRHLLADIFQFGVLHSITFQRYGNILDDRRPGNGIIRSVINKGVL